MLLYALVAVLVVYAAQALIVKPYRIPSGSMTPTLQVGQRILVDRVSEHMGGVHRGSVIVFHPPLDVADGLCGNPQQGAESMSPCGLTVSARQADETFIKRVVGLPGDRIALRDGHLLRNGRPVQEPYIRACPGGDSCTMTDAVTVPRGTVYVMGDNRGASNDSRFWGPVPDGWIVGIARASYWPPSRIGGI